MVRIDDLEKAAVLLNQTQKAPGTVAVLSGETGRFTQFMICLLSLAFKMPEGSSLKWMLGSDIAESRNQACAEITGDWIWFIDDDHVFQDHVLLGLLGRNVDIVTPLCLRRTQPFLPVPAVDDNFLDLNLYGKDDLVEVQHAGSSGMLIRRRVLDAIEPPWFELGRDEQGRSISEDVTFCRKAQAAGFQVHVDMAVRLGHITTAVVDPVWSDDMGRWLTQFTISDGAQLAIEPAEVPELEES